MSDLNQTPNPTPEENTEFHDEYEEFGTIFSAPPEHKRKKTSGSKKRITAIISSVLAVAVLISGIFIIKALIPKKDTDGDTSNNSSSTEYTVVSVDENDVKEVTVTNENGSFRFTATQKSTESDDGSSSTITTEWALVGGDTSLISSDKISSVLGCVLSMTSSQKLTASSEDAFGFVNPTYTAVITKTDDTQITVTAGAEYMGKGYCVKTSESNDIFLADTTTVSSLIFTTEDLYKSFSIDAVDVSSLSEDYAYNGTLAKFDSLSISGTNFPSALKLGMNTDEQLSAYMPYTVTSPENRIGNDTTIGELLGIFSSGISANGIYSADVSTSSLKKYGLDKPYMTVNLKAGSIDSTIKISALQSDGFYAAVSDKSTVICKIDPSSLTFIDYKTEDFYGRSVYISSINELSNMTFITADMNHSFDIVYDDSEDAEEQYVISCDGKKITAEYFQNFYQKFVGLSVADFDTSSASGEAVLTVKFKYSAGGEKTIAFYPSSATKYVYTVDGKPMGRTASSEVANIIKLISRVSENKNVN